MTTHRYADARVRAHVSTSPMARAVHVAMLSMAVSLSAIALSPAIAADAAGAVATREYRIPAGNLGDALFQFATQAGVSVTVAPALVAGKQSIGLNGRYSVEQGFARLLAGSGLEVVDGGKGAYALRRASGTQAEDTLPEVRVTGTEETATGPVAGLVAKRSATGTKTDTSILETPQTVNVIPRKQIEMQGAQTVSQALGYTPGVTSAFGGTDSRYDVITARGGLFLRSYLDGLPLPYSAYSVSVPQFDPFMLERIEVLQGPASVLFGQTTSGGILNMVSRRPQAEPSHEIQVQAGNYGRRQIAFDSTGALDDEGKWLYRITGLARENDGQADFSHEERLLIAPSLTWRPSADTSLTLLTHYQRDDAVPQYQGLPQIGTLLSNPNGKIAWDRFSGEPSHEGMKRDQFGVGYAFEHRLDDTWRFRQNLRYTRVDIDARATPAYAFDGRSISRVATQGIGNGHIFSVDNQAEARFKTGDLSHTVLVGLDYLRQRDDYRFASQLVGPLDLYAPVYGIAIPDLIPRFRTVQELEHLGLYVQDQMRSGRWTWTVGGRFDRAEGDTRNVVADTTVTRKDDAFTGRLGVNYVFDNGLAPYASYSTSFEPLGGTDFAGNAFKPAKSRQWEAGVKYQPHDDLLLTASVFQVTQKNTLTPDTEPGRTNFSTQMGEVETRGINLEARGRVGQRTEVIGAYAYTDSEITKANPNSLGVSQQGRPLARAPRHMASLWLDHKLDPELVQGLSFGGGVRYMGSSFAEPSTDIALPSYTLWDAALHYDLGQGNAAMKGVSLSFSIANLTDRQYVNYCLNNLQCFYGQGRTAQLTLRKRW